MKQPRRRVKASELLGMPIGKTPMMLEKKIASLERELARTEDLVRVLRMAPWQTGSSESPAKGGPRHGSRTVRKPKPRAARETSYSLTAFAPGATFAAQYLFRSPPTCPGPRPWSTSNGLLVTVQP